MKELSIEEKAKRYDEALQRTRKWYDSNTNEGFRGIFEDIFLELRESEDEEIRKSLIKALEICKWCGNKYWSSDLISIDDALAWLEKQGKKDEEILILKDQIESLHAAIEAVKETHRIELEKQGEQKHAEWSEKDEKLINSVIELIDDGALDRDEKDYFIEKLKSLKDRVGNFDDGYKVGFSAAKHNQWKPSQGQLECLGYAIEKAEKDWSPLINNRIYLTLKALKE